MTDLENYILKLDKAAAQADPVERVFGFRVVLTDIHREGFDEGYTAARRDRSTATVLDTRRASHTPGEPE